MQPVPKESVSDCARANRPSEARGLRGILVYLTVRRTAGVRAACVYRGAGFSKSA